MDIREVKALNPTTPIFLRGNVVLENLKSLDCTSLIVDGDLHAPNVEELSLDCDVIVSGDLSLPKLKRVDFRQSFCVGGNLDLSGLERLPDHCIISAGGAVNLEGLKLTGSGCLVRCFGPVSAPKSFFDSYGLDLDEQSRGPIFFEGERFIAVDRQLYCVLVPQVLVYSPLVLVIKVCSGEVLYLHHDDDSYGFGRTAEEALSAYIEYRARWWNE